VIRNLLELTFTLILVYLIVTNASGFANSVRSLGSVYTSSIKALQGR